MFNENCIYFFIHFPLLSTLGPYLDLATISELVRLTGSGGIYKYYNDFSERFVTDLKYSLKSSYAFDTVMKGKQILHEFP